MMFGSEPMRRLLGALLTAWALSSSGAGACGLAGPWYLSSDDGYTGILIVEKEIDDASCEARLSVFSPLGDGAIETCRVLRSDKVVIDCEIISASFFKAPDNFILEDQGEVLKGRWISDISAYVEFTKQ
jgi:predicted small lipoprotein YifL